MSTAMGAVSILNAASIPFNLFSTPLNILTKSLEKKAATPFSSLLECTDAAPLSAITKPLEIRWSQAINDVEIISDMLTNRIRSLSSVKRRKLILIGHSLGGNVTIRTLAQLYRQNLFIHSAVLLGAAIGCKDENIPFAMKATQKPICSMVNPNDAALKVFQTVSGTPALGTGCKLPGYNHSKFIEYPTSTSINHSSVFYLSQWAEVNNVNNNISPIQLLADLTSVFLKNKK